MLLGILTSVATKFMDSYFLILHLFYSNTSLCSWSHIWLTLNKFCFMFSTNKKFSTVASLLLSLTVPLPIIKDDLSFPNVIDPSISLFNVKNASLSPVTCFKHPLSTYHPRFLCWAFRARLHYSVLNWSCFLIHILCGSCLGLMIFFFGSLGGMVSLQFLDIFQKLLHLYHSTSSLNDPNLL